MSELASVRLPISLTPTLRQAADRMAAARGLSLAAWFRLLVANEQQRDQQRQRLRDHGANRVSAFDPVDIERAFEEEVEAWDL